MVREPNRPIPQAVIGHGRGQSSRLRGGLFASPAKTTGSVSAELRIALGRHFADSHGDRLPAPSCPMSLVHASGEDFGVQRFAVHDGEVGDLITLSGGTLRVVDVAWHDEDDEVEGTLTMEVAECD